MSTPKNKPTDRLSEAFDLLKQTEPSLDHYDVIWPGPYVVWPKREWHSTTFMLYDGKLYCNLSMNGRPETIVWQIGTEEIKPESQEADWHWEKLLFDVVKRLRVAIATPAAYNSRIARQIPPESRAGSIERHLTWPKDAPLPLKSTGLRRFRAALTRASIADSWKAMSLESYLATAARCYDSAIPKLKKLSPLEKYRAKADGRHGGMLDLGSDDAEAFKSWFRSSMWSGKHPWEIIYGNPHGIMLSPKYEAPSDTWRFYLSVDSPAWYKSATRMAIALGEADVPFDFVNHDRVISALLGIDSVRIGQGEDLLLEELKRERPDAVARIKWDALSQIQPVSEQGKARISHVLATGSPVGFVWDGVEITPLRNKPSLSDNG